MNRLLMNLALALATLSTGAFADGDCLNFTDLVKKVRADVAAGAKVEATLTDLNWTDAEPEKQWLREYGAEVAALNTDWLTDAKAPIPQQVGCERIKNMGDLEMVIARFTKDELELHLDGDMYLKAMVAQIAKSLGKSADEKPKAPKKAPVERKVVPQPGESLEEAIARTIAEELGNQLGDVLAEAFENAFSDPKVQAALEAEILKQVKVDEVKRIKEDIENRIRFVIRHDEPGRFSLRIKNSYGENESVRSFETTHVIQWGKGELPKVNISANVEAFLAALAEAKKPVAGPVLP